MLGFLRLFRKREPAAVNTSPVSSSGEIETECKCDGDGDGDTVSTSSWTDTAPSVESAPPPQLTLHTTLDTKREMDISNTQMARVLGAYKRCQSDVSVGINSTATRQLQGPHPHKRTTRHGSPPFSSDTGNRVSTEPAQPHTVNDTSPALDCDALDEKWFRILKGSSRRSYRQHGRNVHATVREWGALPASQ